MCECVWCIVFYRFMEEKRAAISRFCCENNRDKANMLYCADKPFSLPVCAQEIAYSSPLYSNRWLEHLLHTHTHWQRVPSTTSFYLFFSHSLKNPFAQTIPAIECWAFLLLHVSIFSSSSSSSSKILPKVSFLFKCCCHLGWWCVMWFFLFRLLAPSLFLCSLKWRNVIASLLNVSNYTKIFVRAKKTKETNNCHKNNNKQRKH